ncbi:MFS transporter [Halostreptopolyspora alba]|uniref:MFS transporter n=1 Tax=Halostreptopolyspora alba TaxID=2487137 RepID=A0A3N0EH96_9ACTN|nr:MFS transporter [Nocardiopsaceae bacterium YIM 96095]
MLLGLDVTVLLLVLPSLAADLEPSGPQALWIVDAYGLLIAGFLITMGTLGDRIGRRRLLMIGAAAFGGASVAAAYSTSAEMLIVTRAALGVAGATLMPSTLALISTMFARARQRALAIGVWATMFALGMAAGPLVGGVLLKHFWWGSVFLVAVPIVGLVLVAAPVLLPEYRARQAGRIDPVSVALSLAALLSMVYAVKDIAAHGARPATLLALATGIVLAVVFVGRQRRLPDPLLDMTLFASRAFSVALGVLLVGLVGVGGVMYLVTQHLQLVEELSPLVAGAWMGPPALMMLAAAIGAPLLARRVRPGYVVAGSLALSSVGYLLIGQISGAGSIPGVVTGFGLVYLGLGALAALGTDLVVGAAPPDRAGSASAMSETAQELGVAVGIATLGSLATAVYRDRIAEDIPERLAPGLSEALGDTLAAAVAVERHLPSGVLQQAKESYTTGMNAASMLAGVAILALAALSAVTLRHIGSIGGDAGQDSAPVSEADTEPARRTPP